MSLLILLLGDLFVLAVRLLTFAIVHVICNYGNLSEPYAFIVSILWSSYPLVMGVVRQMASGYYHINYSTTYKEDLCKTFLTKQ